MHHAAKQWITPSTYRLNLIEWQVLSCAKRYPQSARVLSEFLALSGFAVCVYPPQTTTVCSRGGEVAAAVRTTLCVILKLTRSSSFLLSLYSHGALTQDNNRCVFASPALFGMWISPPFRSFRWPFFVLVPPLIITSLLAEWQPSHLQRRVSPTRSDISSLS